MLIFDRIKKVGIFFQRQSNFLKSELIYEIPTSGNHLQDYLTRNAFLCNFFLKIHTPGPLGKNSSVMELMGICIFKKVLPSDSETLPWLRTSDLGESVGKHLVVSNGENL